MKGDWVTDSWRWRSLTFLNSTRILSPCSVVVSLTFDEVIHIRNVAHLLLSLYVTGQILRCRFCVSLWCYLLWYYTARIYLVRLIERDIKSWCVGFMYTIININTSLVLAYMNTWDLKKNLCNACSCELNSTCNWTCGLLCNNSSAVKEMCKVCKVFHGCSGLYPHWYVLKHTIEQCSILYPVLLADVK